MTDLTPKVPDFPPDPIVYIVISGAFHGGPLDGSSFFFQVPLGYDLNDLRVTLPRPDGMRDLYHYAERPNPTSLEAGLRWIGTIGGSG